MDDQLQKKADELELRLKAQMAELQKMFDELQGMKTKKEPEANKEERLKKLLKQAKTEGFSVRLPIAEGKYYETKKGGRYSRSR